MRGGTLALSAALLMAGAAAFPAEAPAQASPTTHGEWIYIKKGADSIRAYVAYSERSSLSPAVIVIHEIYGLTDWETTVADRLAKEGYIAVVPDLLSSKHGKTPADEGEARKLVGELEPERVIADLDATYAWLNAQPAVDKGNIGTIGFCWGGGQSFRYATSNPDLRAVVVAYGPAPDTADMKTIRAPVLGIYGEHDARINAALPTVQAGMEKAGKNFTAEVFPGTGHGFLKPGRQGYDTPEREKAWTRILEFYRARLGK
ncbi:MAG TPA: dienelactone hydrolase family protein [Gemmatimonadales bacterium]|nr:dienelactone hydrolase family protein [Gemmatimonadales bacterium]